MDLLTAYAAAYADLNAATADGWAKPPAYLSANCDDARIVLKVGIEALISAEKALDAAEAWSPESYQPPPTPDEMAAMRATVAELRTKIGLNQG
jgi:hypothetical protein